MKMHVLKKKCEETFAIWTYAGSCNVSTCGNRDEICNTQNECEIDIDGNQRTGTFTNNECNIPCKICDEGDNKCNENACTKDKCEETFTTWTYDLRCKGAEHINIEKDCHKKKGEWTYNDLRSNFGKWIPNTDINKNTCNIKNFNCDNTNPSK